jgi:hypothetical protein
MTTKNLALAASIAMLVASSGYSSARAAGSYTHRPIATNHRSDQQVGQAFNAFYPATQTVEPNAHRYHGGPKSND